MVVTTRNTETPSGDEAMKLWVTEQLNNVITSFTERLDTMATQFQQSRSGIGESSSRFTSWSSDESLHNIVEGLKNKTLTVTKKRGVLKSDQVLLNGGETNDLVSEYKEDKTKFFEDFAKSMIKMGQINLLTGNRGQVRHNCMRVNSQ
ncbi:heme peroxidase [Artemisia annua]|uniref:peroxidase n=1 Tax=Artemisia annua TaxID=35608 RepID=A0A2U1N939_ARTAN|nr:heme peroxidase [Artemisia annua]